MKTNHEQNPVNRAVNALGGKDQFLADAVGVTHQAVSDWRKKGYISYRKAAQVAAITGIPEFILCPKFFKPPMKTRRKRTATE